MNDLVLHTEVQEFLRQNENTDLFRLVLQPSPFKGIHSRELAEQIDSRKRAKDKLPSWFAANFVYYPNKRYLEQSSSEITAAYKSGLLNASRVFDLSGGFGVDAYYFSKIARKVVYCDTNGDLATIAQHNFRQLGISNIEVIHADGIHWLREKNEKADLIYLDPSRRSLDQKRVFLLEDCEPNVPEHLPILLEHTNNLMVKTSPLLDLSAGILELKCVREIHIIAVNNEVKELLWVLKKGYTGQKRIRTVNFGKKQSQEFSFSYEEEDAAAASFSPPLSYLFEPNAAIMKSGGFKSLGAQLQLPRLDEHSHLYTARELRKFPGRTFKVREVLAYHRKHMQSLPAKANVSTRNFPQSVAELRKRHKIEDGGEVYLFFTHAAGIGLIVIECEKI